MTFEVIVYQQAHDAILRNAVWWAVNHSKIEAEGWKGAIYDQVHQLTHMPKQHALAWENDEFSYELRQLRLGIGKRQTYRALFTVKDSAVHVLDFLAAEQDGVRPYELPSRASEGRP